jgi:hypothetical protein
MWSVVCLLLTVLVESVLAESESKAALNSRRIQMLKDTENNSRFSTTLTVSRSASEALGTSTYHSQSISNGDFMTVSTGWHTPRDLNDRFGVTATSQEQLALETLYNATNGDSWTDNTGWKTASDLNDWFGVTATSSTVVTVLLLKNNCLAGVCVCECATLCMCMGVLLLCSMFIMHTSTVILSSGA